MTSNFDKHQETLARIERLDGNSAIAECEAARIDVDDIANAIKKRVRRLDAGETGALARALLHLRAQSIDVIYAKTGFRQVLPLLTSVPEGATTYSVPQYDMVGDAKLITNYADDLPRVNASVLENTVSIKRYGTSYEYSIDDLARAAMAGNMLDSKRQKAAKDILERKHDTLAVFGDSVAGLGGFANNSSVDAVALASAGTWATKAAATEGYKIHADIVKLCQNIVDDTVGEFKADTLAMTPGMAFLVRTSVMSTTDSRTVIQALRDSGLPIDILEWQRLGLADAGLDGPRVIAFQRDPNVVEYVAPGGGFTEESPQMQNLAFVVNCHGRSAGTCIYQPKAVSYMDVG
jgi:hypothetical protein